MENSQANTHMSCFCFTFPMRNSQANTQMSCFYFTFPMGNSHANIHMSCFYFTFPSGNSHANKHNYVVFLTGFSFCSRLWFAQFHRSHGEFESVSRRIASFYRVALPILVLVTFIKGLASTTVFVAVVSDSQPATF